MKYRIKNLLLIVLAATLLLTACGSSSSNNKDDIVLKIGGRDITKSEYMFSLYNSTLNLLSAYGDGVWEMDIEGKTADEAVEEQAIQALQTLVAVRKYADEHGITLSEQEKSQLETSAKQFISILSKEDLKKMGMDQKRLIPLMESSFLYSAVYSAISEEYVADDSKVEELFENNKEALLEEFKLLKLHSIVVDDQKTAEEVISKAKAGEDFSVLFDKYDTAGNIAGEGANGEMTVYRYVLESQYGLSPDAKVGDIEGPFNMGSTYFILKVISEEEPELEKVKAMVGETYHTNMKAVFAEEKMNGLIAQQTAEKVGTAWEAMEKFH